MNLNEEEVKEVLDHLNFGRGLITAVVRDRADKEVLMVAFMNEEAVRKTLVTGIMHFWSRERGELWKKGEESGNIQKVEGARIDCDGDALLFDVEPEGPACHRGYRSCFYRKIGEEGKISRIMEREFDPDEVY